MCEKCKLSPEDEAAREVRMAAAVEAMRVALFGNLDADGNPTPPPEFTPETLGELADVIMGFTFAVDGAMMQGNLVRAVIDAGLTALELRAATNAAQQDGVATLIDMLRSGQATVARGPLFGVNVNDSGIPTGDRVPDDATPGMYL